MTTYASLSASPWIQVLDDNGVPYPGAKCYTYEAGTSTPKATYTDYDSGIVQSNPIVADSGGVMSIWLGTGLYKLIFKDTDDNLIRTIDNVGASGSGLTMAMVVNTVIGSSSSLKALAANASNAVIALGYASVSDNAGGLFRWSSTTTSGEDDGIVVDGNTSYSSDGRWVRDVPGYIDPRWYGAAGDGVTSDVTEFAAALVYAAANALPLKIREGNYYLNSSVTFGTTPVEFDPKAKFTFSNFAPSLNAVITDVNQHFICSAAAYVPHFPAGTLADPRWFGAATTSTDNYLYIQEAVNSLASGGTVSIVDGTYQVADTITLANNMQVKGDGTNGLIVTSAWAGTDFVIGGNGLSGTIVDSLPVKSRTDKTAVGIWVDGTDCVVRDNLVSNCNTVGIAISSNVTARNNTCVGCSITGGSKAGYGLTIDNNEIINPSTIAIYVADAADADVHGPVNVTGNKIQTNYDSTSVVYAYNYGYSPTYYRISDNVIYTGNHAVTAIAGYGLSRAMITNNAIIGSSSTDGTAVSLQACTDTSVANNVQVHNSNYLLTGYKETLADSLHANYGGDTTVDNNLIVKVDATVINDLLVKGNLKFNTGLIGYSQETNLIAANGLKILGSSGNNVACVINSDTSNSRYFKINDAVGSNLKIDAKMTDSTEVYEVRAILVNRVSTYDASTIYPALTTDGTYTAVCPLRWMDATTVSITRPTSEDASSSATQTTGRYCLNNYPSPGGTLDFVGIPYGPLLSNTVAFATGATQGQETADWSATNVTFTYASGVTTVNDIFAIFGTAREYHKEYRFFNFYNPANGTSVITGTGASFDSLSVLKTDGTKIPAITTPFYIGSTGRLQVYATLNYQTSDSTIAI